ncbi:MAG TPA: hypothetical protein VNH44_10645, partial [Micropepsaceae bacterium]|nr:hypothetical protein [Micropepsaceae bacterium]
MDALALPVLAAEARLSSTVIWRSLVSTRVMAAWFKPRAGVDLLWTLPRKPGFAVALLAEGPVPAVVPMFELTLRFAGAVGSGIAPAVPAGAVLPPAV